MTQDNGKEPNADWFQMGEEPLLDEDFDLEDYELDIVKADFSDALEAIQADAITPFDLTGFGDLSRKQVHEVRAVWETLPLEKRQMLADLVQMVAREYIYSDFGRFLGVLLGDSDERVRLSAAQGAMLSQEVNNIKPLADLAENDANEDVRLAAIEALAGYMVGMDMGESYDAQDTRRLAQLRTWAMDESWPSRLRAASLVSWASNPADNSIGQIIEQFALSDDEELMLGATRAMSSWGAGNMLPFLEKQLRSLDADHREAAALALGQANDASVVPMLTMLAREEKEPAVREAAYVGLSEQGSKQALLALQELRKHAAEDDWDFLDVSIANVKELMEMDDLPGFEFDDGVDEDDDQ